MNTWFIPQPMEKKQINSNSLMELKLNYYLLLWSYSPEKKFDIFNHHYTSDPCPWMNLFSLLKNVDIILSDPVLASVSIIFSLEQL